LIFQFPTGRFLIPRLYLIFGMLALQNPPPSASRDNDEYLTSASFFIARDFQRAVLLDG